MREKVGESGGKGLAVVLMGVAAYSAYWSWFSITRYYDLFATYWDLGIYMAIMWNIVSGRSLALYLLNSPLQVALSPLILFRSAPLLLALQSVWIGAGALPVYGVARHYLKDDAASALLALSYLIYFPLAPGNAFDVHNQVLFATPFLTGAYLYLEGKLKASFAFLSLSAVSKYLYAVFPGLFALTVLGGLAAEWLRGRRGGPGRSAIEAAGTDEEGKGEREGKGEGEPQPQPEREPERKGGGEGERAEGGGKEAGFSGKGRRVRLTFALALLSLSAFLLAAQYLFLFHSSLAGHVPSSSVAYSAGALGYGYPQKLYTLFCLFFPLLFLPLLSKRWFILYLPYLFALFYLDFWGYEFPFDQYAYGIAPFLFLGAAEGASWVGARLPRATPRRLAAACFLVLVAFSLFYEPYGPLFSPRSPRPPFISPYYDNNGNGVLQVKEPDARAYGALLSALSLVPPSSPLLVEDNAPEAWDKLTLWGIPPSRASEAQFALLDFHVDDGVSAVWLYTRAGYPVFGESALSLAESLLSRGYGIYAELDGFALLKANYSGPPVRYSPLVETLPASEFWTPSLGARPGDAPANASFYGPYDELFAVRFRGLGYGVVPEWYGPYSALPPGEFNVTFEVKGEPGEAADFYVQAYNGSVELASSALVLSGAWQGVTLTVSSGSFYGWVGFGCSTAGPAVELRGVEVVQVAPPSRNRGRGGRPHWA